MVGCSVSVQREWLSPRAFSDGCSWVGPLPLTTDPLATKLLPSLIDSVFILHSPSPRSLLHQVVTRDPRPQRQAASAYS